MSVLVDRHITFTEDAVLLRDILRWATGKGDRKEKQDGYIMQAFVGT